MNEAVSQQGICLSTVIEVSGHLLLVLSLFPPQEQTPVIEAPSTPDVPVHEQQQQPTRSLSMNSSSRCKHKGNPSL